MSDAEVLAAVLKGLVWIVSKAIDWAFALGFAWFVLEWRPRK